MAFSRFMAFSIRLREPGLHARRDVALDELTARARGTERDVAERGLGLGLDRGLALGAAAPVRDDEAGTAVHGGLEGVPRRDLGGVLLAEFPRAREEVRLDLLEQRGHTGREIGERDRGLLAR